jgi:hypothetical protein
VNRHAWLQKHPSPLATGGEFHWYPDAPQAADRELRASFVERVRGIEPPAVLWQLEPGRVAWGQVFSATAPLDGRRYVGLVLSIVEGDDPAVDLLAAVAPPPPEPWTPGAAPAVAPRTEVGRREPGPRTEVGRREPGPCTEVERREPGSRTLKPRHRPTAKGAAAPVLAVPAVRELAGQELEVFPRQLHGDIAGVVRALLDGGTARVDEPASADLPRWTASIDRVLPAPSKLRRGVWNAVEQRAAGRDRVAELAAAAWREPGSRAAKAWTLLCELAVARGESIDRVGVALEAVDATAVLTAAERAEISGCRGVVDVLHAWGRGRFDRSPSADTLPARLADLVALRVLARLAAGDDPRDAIAEARWHGLLSAQRRTALLDAVAQRTSSLRALVEAHHV